MMARASRRAKRCKKGECPMAQGKFTKEEARSSREAVNEMFHALPRKKSFEYIGHLNDILLFLEAAEKAAPTEAEAKAGKG
jgi:hypothetical protein